QGETILLLRKGGIREAKGQFSLAARQVLLLPTLEHQKTALLKPPFQPLAEAGPPIDADPICFTSWATITHALPLTAPAEVTPLLPYLIWNQQFVAERLGWQPDRPLYGLLLRAYRLESPLVLPRHAGYGGCRSWVEIGQSVTVSNRTPALSEADYTDRANAILATLPSITPIVPPTVSA
ncbi:MAG: DUF1802 family protein, partial [Leptolyngbya sp. DLM2.Bin27]